MKRIAGGIAITFLSLLAFVALLAVLFRVLGVGATDGMKIEVFANLVLSGLLVAVTVFYAWQSALAAQEMKTARAPHVDVDVRRFGDKFMAYVRNVGGGPALDIVLDLRLSSTVDDVTDRWERSLLPGEEQLLLFPKWGTDLMTRSHAVESDAVLTAKGTCRDVRGATWEISNTINLRPRFEGTIEGSIEDVEARLYSNIEKTRRAVEAIAKSMA